MIEGFCPNGMDANRRKAPMSTGIVCIENAAFPTGKAATFMMLYGNQ